MLATLLHPPSDRDLPTQRALGRAGSSTALPEVASSCFSCFLLHLAQKPQKTQAEIQLFHNV